MSMRQPMRSTGGALVLGIGASLTACGVTPILSPPEGSRSTDVSPTDLPPAQHLSATQLKYLLKDVFGEPFFCDPDYYPVARGDEEQKALEWFAQVDLASEEIQAILARLGLQGSSLPDGEKLLLYRE